MKSALQLLIAASALRRHHRRIDRVWVIALMCSFVTLALIALNLWQRGAIG